MIARSVLFVLWLVATSAISAGLFLIGSAVFDDSLRATVGLVSGQLGGSVGTVLMLYTLARQGS